MKKNIDTKKLLFENMEKLNPDFKLNEGDDKWIQKAVDPEHKGYCTPMTKPTCTPKRKALAKRFKKGIDENIGTRETIYTFKTNAITKTLGDSDKEYTHPVHLIQGNPKYAPIYDGIVLSIDGTPGSWYVDNLMEGSTKNSNYIYIDMGAKWICSNWSEIMRELREWISNNNMNEGIDFNLLGGEDATKKKAEEIKAKIDEWYKDGEDEAISAIYTFLMRKGKPFPLPSPEELKEIFDRLNEKEDSCWKGYETIGMKEKDGEKVPNCVPKNKNN